MKKFIGSALLVIGIANFNVIMALVGIAFLVSGGKKG